MKPKQLLLSLLALLASITANAYSFKYNGVYYSTSGSGNSAYVTYQNYGRAYSASNVPNGYYYEEMDIGGDEEYFWVYDYYYSDMSGAITIPSTVTYNGTTYNVVGIYDHAFDNCSVTSITIQSNNLTSIGKKAFRQFAGALTINCQLEFKETHYDDDGDPYYETYYPFSYCKFTSLTLGSNITSIPGSSLGNNTALRSLTLPSSLTSIGSSAFSSCSALTTLTLPSSLTSIGSSAFSGCSNLAVIDINATNLTSIGSGAFINCSKLKTVNLNSIASWLHCTLSSESASPFYNGADLYVADEEKTTISFPVATAKIPAYAFYGCRNITSVTIPAQVNTIGTGAFGNCPNLTAINVNSNNSNYCSEDGILYNANKTTLLQCLATKSGAITIPQTVTTIQASAFSGCSGITSITLPSSLTSIGDYAFRNCSGITSVTLPNTLTSVSNNPFSGCSGITTVNVKIVDISSISSNRISYSFLPTSAIWNYYINNDLITSLTIPSSITTIGRYAFYNAKGITSITLPNTLTCIQDEAFHGCSGLSTITLPSSLTSIGGWAFYGCRGKLIINCNIPNVTYSPLRNSSFSEIIIGDNVTNIGSRAFENQHITSLTLPNTVTIGGNSVSADTVNVRINDISTISTNSVLWKTISSSFWNYYLNDTLLTTLDIPSSITSIGDDAFYNAKGITSITLPNSLTSIGSCAFSGCTGITSLTLPSSLTSIGGSAFHGCSGTLTVNCNIPDVVYYNSPFYDSSFNIVIIGNNVTNIGNYVLYSCTPTAFICKATTPPTLGSNNAFGGSKKIYVPYKSLDAYKNAWSQLSTPTYTYLPLLDVMFFEQQTAESYAAELVNKNKSQITSVAFYEGGLDTNLTESVLKNGMNPNCLYYVPASAGISGNNIIKLDSYEAQKVSLTDNYAYDCPIPFHAEEIEYVHNPSVWANGSAGWETICLPFAPDVFEASERGYISPIMLGSTGNFWLRKFVGASSDAVYFSSTIDGQMEANTPYLVAFPGSSMGNGHLEGQTITFKGYDADIQVTEQPEVRNNNFIFVGNYDTAADGIEGYALNAAGSMFTRSTNVGNQPFRAYFRNEAGQASNVKLFIDPDNPTDIRSLAAPSDLSISSLGNGSLAIQSSSDRQIHIYSIDGRLERTLQLTAGENRIDGLHKGLYIIDNKKIMIR